MITREYMTFTLVQWAARLGNVATFLAFAEHLPDMGLTFRTVNIYLSDLKSTLTRLGISL